MKLFWLKWLVVPMALGIGAAGGVLVTRSMMARDPLPVVDPAPAPAAPEMKPPASAEDGDESEHPWEPIPELVPPPGYFDLEAPNKQDGTDPPIVKPGQWIQVEVLEALPGRPITGSRMVRSDGTISLGFYGDLRVAGLNRDQIKVKLIEHLRRYIKDEVLGFIKLNRIDGHWELVPPVETNRVFVDESPGISNVDQGQPTYAPAKVGSMEQDYLRSRVDALERKLDIFLLQLAKSPGGQPSAGSSEEKKVQTGKNAQPAPSSPELKVPKTP